MVACFLSFSLDMHRPHVATGFLGSDCCGEREERLVNAACGPYLHRKSSVAGTRGDFESAVCLSRPLHAAVGIWWLPLAPRPPPRPLAAGWAWHAGSTIAARRDHAK